VEFLKVVQSELYVDQAGRPTGEAINFRYALAPVVKMFGSIPCSEFSPLKLKAVRNDLVTRHVRTPVNKHIFRIRQVFRWGVENEMVPGAVVTELECVKSLRKGRCEARESEPVQPVPDADLKASLGKMAPITSVMVRLMVLSGARVSEIRLMRMGDIDTTGEVWLYRPQHHKNSWRGKDRTIFFGPRAQVELMPFIGDSLQADQYVFRPKVKANKPYTLTGLLSSIRWGCVRSEVPVWSSGRLRHNAAMEIRKAFGDIDAARVVLGHSEKSTRIFTRNGTWPRRRRLPGRLALSVSPPKTLKQSSLSSKMNSRTRTTKSAA
jgi:integrase